MEKKNFRSFEGKGHVVCFEGNPYKPAGVWGSHEEAEKWITKNVAEKGRKKWTVRPE